MENTIEEESETTETSGTFTLDGEAWRDRDSTTYTSLLDLYGASDLFSEESNDLYEELKQEQMVAQQGMTDYIFSGQMQAESREEELIEYIFSKEIEFSRVRSYDNEESNYFILFVLAGILAVLIFISIMVKWNTNRKKRREMYATEVDLENEGTYRY